MPESDGLPEVLRNAYDALRSETERFPGEKSVARKTIGEIAAKRLSQEVFKFKPEEL